MRALRPGATRVQQVRQHSRVILFLCDKEFDRDRIIRVTSGSGILDQVPSVATLAHLELLQTPRHRRVKPTACRPLGLRGRCSASCPLAKLIRPAGRLDLRCLVVVLHSSELPVVDDDMCLQPVGPAVSKQALPARHIHELAQMQLVRNGNRRRRTIPMLTQDDVGLTGAWVVALEGVGAVQQDHHIRILLE